MALLKLNSRGREVRSIQLLLNSKVVPRPNLTVDGNFGERTRSAVVAFQGAKGLIPDGEVGPRTRVALGLKSIAISATPARAEQGALIDIAVAELGVHEESIPGHHNSRILEYHQTTTLRASDDETPWCSSFVNWTVRQAGRRGTNNAAAKSWLAWGTPVIDPHPGDIIVIKKKTPGLTQATGSASGYHVGFYISSTPTHVRILGGNQSDSVKYSNFPLSTYEVQGYRR